VLQVCGEIAEEGSLLAVVSGDAGRGLGFREGNLSMPRPLCAYYIRMQYNKQVICVYVCIYVQGSMTVVVQEFDGCFPHNIQIEDPVSSHELPCHSKIRKYGIFRMVEMY